MIAQDIAHATSVPPPKRGTATRLLIIDDDIPAAAALRLELEAQGYWVDVESTLPAQISAAGSMTHALVIIDGSAPRVDVIARILAILRPTREPHLADDMLRSGRLAMWPAERRAEWQGQPLKLTSTEFNLLEILLRAVGRPVSKAELSRRALGRPPARYERSIDVHLSSVRRKLGVLADGRPLIQAVHLHGYQLLKE